MECYWRPPPQGWLKFNVDGVVYEDVVRGGGVLRDEDGVVRAIFTGPSEEKDADMAEVGAIKVALDLFSGMGWPINCPLLVEVGSNLVLNWLSEIKSRSRILQSIFINIDG